MPLYAGLIIAAVGGAYEIYKGSKQESQAANIQRTNIRSPYPIPDEYFNNQAIAESQAESGLGEGAINYYSTQSDRGLSSAIDAITKTGGDPNSMSKVYDAYNQGNLRTAAEDSQLKYQHINQLLGANKDVAGQETQKWALDFYEPYKDKAKLASELSTAGQQNVKSGISSVGSSFSSFDQASNYDKFLETGGGGRSSVGALPTFGDIGGNGQIDSGNLRRAGVTSQPIWQPRSLPNSDVYTTPAGSDFMNRQLKVSPESDELDSLQQLINGGKI